MCEISPGVIAIVTRRKYIEETPESRGRLTEENLYDFRRQLGRVAVYCASNPGRDPAFPRLAAELGAELARRGIELVYGGSDAGLMRIVASSVLANGGRVTGVHPEGHPIEAPQRDLTRLCVVKSMAGTRRRLAGAARRLRHAG